MGFVIPVVQDFTQTENKANVVIKYSLQLLYMLSNRQTNSQDCPLDGKFFVISNYSNIVLITYALIGRKFSQHTILQR